MAYNPLRVIASQYPIRTGSWIEMAFGISAFEHSTPYCKRVCKEINDNRIQRATNSDNCSQNYPNGMDETTYLSVSLIGLSVEESIPMFLPLRGKAIYPYMRFFSASRR